MLPYVIKFSCSKVIKKLKIKHKLSTQAKKKTNPKDTLLLSTYSFWAVLQASWCECLGSIHFDWQLWSDMTTWVARERERLVLLLFPNGPSASLIRISGGGTQALEIGKKKKKGQSFKSLIRFAGSCVKILALRLFGQRSSNTGLAILRKDFRKIVISSFSSSFLPS